MVVKTLWLQSSLPVHFLENCFTLVCLSPYLFGKQYLLSHCSFYLRVKNIVREKYLLKLSFEYCNLLNLCLVNSIHYLIAVTLCVCARVWLY